jgi:propane monooxygenase reductase subunit
MRHLVLRMIEPAEIKFFPGQYMDIAIPGTDQVRSFSMANTSSRESGLLEFVIKVYPDGQFSEFLAERLAEGDRLDITGPFGVFTLREGDNDLVFVGGGAGMAPILALLRTMAERGLNRKATFYYGARTARISASRRSCASSRASCRTSATSRRCPSREPRRTRNGTARPA